MIYNTKLNEFEPETLNALLQVVDAKIADLIAEMKDISIWAKSDLRQSLIAEREARIETFLLWKVQLENAKSDINEMIKINAG